MHFRAFPTGSEISGISSITAHDYPRDLALLEVGFRAFFLLLFLKSALGTALGAT